MSEGRLIRVSKFRGDPQVVAYLVALPDKAQALKIIRDRVAMPEEEIRDRGRVSENLLMAFSLASGNILPGPRCSARGRTATANSAESCAQEDSEALPCSGLIALRRANISSLLRR